MDFETITVENNNAVGLITLNRPASMNAVCAAMLYELAQAVSAFDAEESIRVIVLKGETDFFAPGINILDIGVNTMRFQCRFFQRTSFVFLHDVINIGPVDFMAFSVGLKVARL